MMTSGGSNHCSGPTTHFLPGGPLSLGLDSFLELGSSNSAAHRFELQLMQGSNLGTTTLLPDETSSHFNEQGSWRQGWTHLQLDELLPFPNSGQQQDPFQLQLHRRMPWEPQQWKKTYQWEQQLAAVEQQRQQHQNHEWGHQLQDMGWESIKRDCSEPCSFFEHKSSPAIVNLKPFAARYSQPPADVTKNRIRWTPELHSHFMQCIQSLGGLNRCTPKAILKLMSAGGHKLNIHHIKSHLQKYRLNCKEAKLEGKTTNAKGSAASESCPPAPVPSDEAAALSLSHKTQTLSDPLEAHTTLQLPDAQGGDQIHSRGVAGPSDMRLSDAALSIDCDSGNSSLCKRDAETSSGRDLLPRPSLAIQEALRVQATLQRQMKENLKLQQELQRSLKDHLSNLSLLLAAEGLDPAIQEQLQLHVDMW